ncbi:hypothetical protein ACHMW6_28805 [Pseudoduganella sp. UC29_106]|uniref:hypothetical protein n=1 Tax=Pseudoduganella sp. UC29_106 TaxID=3374553 RepID=UPI0037583801
MADCAAVAMRAASSSDTPGPLSAISMHGCPLRATGRHQHFARVHAVRGFR